MTADTALHFFLQLVCLTLGFSWGYFKARRRNIEDLIDLLKSRRYDIYREQWDKRSKKQ